MESGEQQENARDDAVEGGALEEEGGAAERPPMRDEPVESGGLEDEPATEDA
jgi:hypothetical protein